MDQLNYLISQTSLYATLIILCAGYATRLLISTKIPLKTNFVKDSIFETLYLGLFSFIFSGFPAICLWDYPSYWLKFFAIILVVLNLTVLPWIIFLFVTKTYNSEWFRNKLGVHDPSAWDWMFKLIENKTKGKNPYTIVITSKNNDVIIGLYDNESYSTSYPNEKSIYLSKLIVDGEIIESGLYIKEDNIAKIEIMDIVYNEEKL